MIGGVWTPQGRFGGALVFNGTSARVSGPSISLGPAFTLMAWVLNPTRTAYETVMTVGGNRDFYLGNGVPTFYTGSADLTFGSALANGVWQHVALVSDGSTLRAYLNGAPFGTTRTVALGAVTGPLQVGAWIIGAASADYFAGTIDEVRVYSRALSQGEVQTVMNVAVGTPPADTTPPVRSGGQPTGSLPVGTTQTTLALTTNEGATCRYSASAGDHPTSHGEESGTRGSDDSGSGSPGVHCRPVPATVVTPPSARCRPRSAWFTVSATTTSYPTRSRTSSGSRHNPCGSLKRASPASPSTRPRTPEPMRRSSVSPSAASSTNE